VHYFFQDFSVDKWPTQVYTFITTWVGCCALTGGFHCSLEALVLVGQWMSGSTDILKQTN
jgi:hypothetical protein